MTAMTPDQETSTTTQRDVLDASQANDSVRDLVVSLHSILLKLLQLKVMEAVVFMKQVQEWLL